MIKIFSKTILLAILTTLIPYTWISATSPTLPTWVVDQNTTASNAEIIKSYRNYSTVSTPNIVVPTVVEADFSLNDVYSNLFGVYNETTQRFIPSKLMNMEQLSTSVSSSVETTKSVNTSSLFDGNPLTTIDFYLDNNQNKGLANINVSFSSIVKSNSLTLILDNYVSLPLTVTIKANVSGREVVVLNKYVPNSSRLNFPETVAKDWIVELTYSQPLRISELKFNNLFNNVSKKSLRFLALPGNNYKIYSNQENPTRNYADNEEAPNLTTNEGVKRIGILSVISNPAFVLSDRDFDQIPDINDNCVSVSNTIQEDIDGNGRGDLCDDYDRDSVINSLDNCPEIVNSVQSDTDADDIGDACDPDESRFTEKYPFIVWTGIGFAALVFIGLLFMAGNKMRKGHMEVPPAPPAPPVPPNLI